MMTDEEKRLDRNAKRRAYYVRRRDYLLALNTAQRVKRQKAEGRYTEHDVRRILKDQKGKCGFCAKKLRNDYHVDHITPLAKGGTNWPHNIQVLCQPCNNRKAAKDPIVFAQENGKLL